VYDETCDIRDRLSPSLVPCAAADEQELAPLEGKRFEKICHRKYNAFDHRTEHAGPVVDRRQAAELRPRIRIDHGCYDAAFRQIGQIGQPPGPRRRGIEHGVIMWPGTFAAKGQTFGKWIASQSRKALADHVVAEVTEGMNGTDIKGGVVKFGTGYNTMTESETKVLLAVLDAHKETGAPVHSHTELGTMALEQLDLVRQEGVDPTRLTIAHLDRNPDPWLHRKVAETGAFFSFDGITRVKYYSEDVRTRCILDLVRWGHEDQVMVGGDIARRTMFASYGEGGLGMGFILEKWVPRFVEEAGEAGFDGEKLVDKFFVQNPQRAFAFRA
jgi:predicted metal-dependent phosphotriesterase family hydrolase